MRVWLVLALMGCTAIRPLGPGADASGSDGGAATDAARGDDAGPAACAGPELCDGVDNDCDPGTRDGADEPTLGAPCDGMDDDACEQGRVVCAAGALRCDEVGAGQVEVCGGGDEDCDGDVDEAGAVGQTPWAPDVDGDGFGDAATTVLACSAPAGHVASSDDCDDSLASRNPDAPDVCNGVDDDCDGAVDERVVCSPFCRAVLRGGRTYQLCNNPQTWNGARAICQGFGYDLVVIDDASENAFLAGDFTEDPSVWIGLSAMMTPTYRWVDGSPLTYTSWEAGRPADDPCVRLVTDTAEWQDSSCDNRRPFICESGLP